jgi:hypothetical protein
LCGLWLLNLAVLWRRLRHVFAAKYTVSDAGIDVVSRPDASQRIPWSEFTRVIVHCTAWIIELHSPRLQLPLAITNADADPNRQRYSKAKSMIEGKLAHLIEYRLL